MSDPNFNLAEWGAEEHAARLEDLAHVKAGLCTLADIQAEAKMRREAVGLSLNAATAAVSDHVRSLRWQSLSARDQTP